MGFLGACLAALLFFGPLAADTGHLLYLAKNGKIQAAVAEYRKHQAAHGGHDFETLHHLGVALLQGAQQRGTPEEQLLAAFGAGVAGDARMLPVLQGALASEHPEVQVVAVNLLAAMEDDRADALLLRAMASPWPIVRLEAGVHLARKRHPEVVNQLEAFMVKVPPPARVLFPQLFVLVGTPQADRVLYRFLADADPNLQRAAVLSLAQAGRDDFLPEIRRLSQHIDPLQQEACATALGLLQDSESIGRLEQLAGTGAPSVKVAANRSLYQLGDEEAAAAIGRLALGGDPFAAAALSEIEGAEGTLARLLSSGDLTLRANATFSLLLRKDSRCLQGLRELLVRDSRDLGFAIQPTVAGALIALRPFHSASAKVEEYPALPEVSHRLRESLLVEASNLPEQTFLELAASIFASGQTDLIPVLTSILENMRSEDAIGLLKRESQHIGAPLIRGYANLALFRAQIDGPYADNLRAQVERQWQSELIQFRPVVPYADRARTDPKPYTLTPEESSRLLIESIEAIAQRQDSEAVDILLNTLQRGNPANACPIAGLLIRITQ